MAGPVDFRGIDSTRKVDVEGTEVETASAAPSAEAAAALARGARGPAVEKLQELLVKAGMALDFGADGIYGSGTASAVARFQKAKGLPASGEADAATMAALEKAAAGSPAAATSPTDDVPKNKLVTGFRLTGSTPFADPSPNAAGTPKTLTATIGGREVQLADDALLVRSLAGGRYLAWSTSKGSGRLSRADDPGEALMLYDARTGKTTKVMSEHYKVEDIHHRRLKDGRDALVVPLRNEASSHALAVIDVARGGEVDRRLAKLVSVSGDGFTMQGLDEYGFPAGEKKTADLAASLAGPVMQLKLRTP